MQATSGMSLQSENVLWQYDWDQVHLFVRISVRRGHRVVFFVFAAQNTRGALTRGECKQELSGRGA